MSLLRPLLALAVIVGAVLVGMRLVPHHANPDPFQALFSHLNPEKLLAHPAAHHEGAPGEGAEHHSEHAPGAQAGHGAHEGVHEPGAAPEYLLSVGLPAGLAFFDMDAAREGVQLVATNLQLFQVAAVLLIFVLFLGVPGHLRTGRGDFFSRLFGGFAAWVRDEMVVPVMGKELGNKLLPLFLSLFFFILFMNLLGLIPGGATATANIFVTGALALLTLCLMVFGGMVAQGPLAFWKNLVPHVPLALWPLMFVVELIGLMVKPFALMIRLFANMTGGHLVVLSFMGLIFFFGALSPAVGYAVSPVAVGFAVFIMIIESFVALLQAYIFTLLSILFVHASVHPEH